ncbi:SDR family oxidoreductase [Mycolicibacterium sp. jd]|uniref:SDR family oxidoreductase n=1 Tax=unclassified Mycolicibacterium TaxID=2636767 RepID=UPI00351BEB12
MDAGLTGKVTLVLGGAGGLGRAMGRALAREGARVVLGDRDADGVTAAAAQITDQGGRALPLTWDLSDLNQIDSHVTTIEKHWGPVDVLVNNTGGPAPAPVTGISAQAWQEAFGFMVLPVIGITDRVLPAMRSAGWGRIITSTSSGVVAPIPNLGVSNTLRAALLGWSKTLAAEEAAHGITVNVLAPGRIGTARTTSLDKKRAEREGTTVAEVHAASTASIPVGRYGDPDEYAAAATFLASTAASYITGSVLRVDGGYIRSI